MHFYQAERQKEFFGLSRITDRLIRFSEHEFLEFYELYNYSF